MLYSGTRPLTTQRAWTSTGSRLHSMNGGARLGPHTRVLSSREAAGTPRNARTQSSKLGVTWERWSCASRGWPAGLKGSLLVAIVGLSTHEDPREEAGFAVFPHLSQTRLLVESHPELQGHLSFPRETHPQ